MSSTRHGRHTSIIMVIMNICEFLSRFFKNLTSFSSDNAINLVVKIPPIYRWGNKVREITIFAQVTHMLNDEAGPWVDSNSFCYFRKTGQGFNSPSWFPPIPGWLKSGKRRSPRPYKIHLQGSHLFSSSQSTGQFTVLQMHFTFLLLGASLVHYS